MDLNKKKKEELIAIIEELRLEIEDLRSKLNVTKVVTKEVYIEKPITDEQAIARVIELVNDKSMKRRLMRLFIK